MGEFYSRDGSNPPVGFGKGAVLAEFTDQSFEVSNAYVVGEADGLVAFREARRTCSMGERAPSLRKVWV